MSSIFYSDIQNSSEINTGSERVVYKVPQGKDATIVINAINTGASADAIRIAIKDYDKQIKFSNNEVNLDPDLNSVSYGQKFSTYSITTSSGDLGNVPDGTSLTFSGGTTAKVLKSYEDYSLTSLVVTEELVDALTVNSLSTFEVGDSIEDSGGNTIATIVAIDVSLSVLYVQITNAGPSFTNESITGISPSTGSATITQVLTGEDALFFDGNFAGNINISPGQLYKFDVSDSGLNGFNIYTDAILTSPYLDGVSLYRSVGQAGAYVLLQVTTDTPSTLYYGFSSYEQNIKTLTKITSVLTGNERSLLLYDISGNITSSETFTYNTTSYTIASVNSGAYGRINRYVDSNNELKVFIDYGTLDEGEIFISPVSNYYYSIDQVYNLKLEDHIEFDAVLDPKKSMQRSAIVLGSEYSVVTLSDSGDTTFNVYGFEE